MRSNVLPQAPIKGFDEFPPHIWIIHYREAKKYACFEHFGINGLAAFSDEADAEYFACSIAEAHCLTSGLDIRQVTFEEARIVAKGRPLPIVSLILLDDFNDPLVHWVK